MLTDVIYRVTGFTHKRKPNHSTRPQFKKWGVVLFLVFSTLSAHAQSITPQALNVQKEMPKNQVIAHRGTIFWAPELTEAAFRWARNSAADYLELDVHRTKDGQLVVMHDKTLKRTTNVATVFPGRENDPIGTFTMAELLQLDAGILFNEKNPNQARSSFVGQGVLAFEDVFRIAEGKRIKRNPDGSRVYHRTTDGGYQFVYEDDPADNGHRPGVIIETKIPETYLGLEEQMYQALSDFGWNPLEKNGRKISKHFYRKGKVNVGNTKGKILVQTFSREGMLRFKEVFKEEIPVSFLIKSPDPTKSGAEKSFDEIVDFTIQSGAQFIGTNVSVQDGEVSNKQFLEKIRAAGLKINIYSFNNDEEMDSYFGDQKDSNAKPLLDGMITNRADLTTHFYKRHHSRSIAPSQDPKIILEELGY
ncbi:MAG: glycerophosphodiester phosphodiesterase family protein [Proteiniphilum sp.]|nr:glycerophosphodiester phosphodiesterase family protein [Proteiniphilum sp.]